MFHINPFVNWAFLRDCTPMSRQVETKRDARTQHSQISSTMRQACKMPQATVQSGKAVEPSRMAIFRHHLGLLQFGKCPALDLSLSTRPGCQPSPGHLDIGIFQKSPNQHTQAQTLIIFPQTSFFTFPLCLHRGHSHSSSPCPTACGPAFPSQYLSCYCCPLLSFCPDHHSTSSHVFLQ